MTAVIVEDEALIRMYLVGALSRRGLSIVAETAAGRQAIDLIRDHRPDVAFLDIRLADDVDGVAVAQSFAGEDGPAIVLMSAYPVDLSSLQQSIPKLVTFVSKPTTEHDLDVAVGQLTQFTL